MKPIIKVCAKHGELTLDQISPRKECKKCIAIYRKKTYAKNKHKYVEGVRRANRKYKKKNPEKIKAIQQKYKENNYEKLLLIARISNRKRRIKYKDKINKQNYPSRLRAIKNLGNVYVRNRISRKLKIKQKDIPIWMVSMFRIIFQINRKIKEMNEN